VEIRRHRCLIFGEFRIIESELGDYMDQPNLVATFSVGCMSAV